MYVVQCIDWLFCGGGNAQFFRTAVTFTHRTARKFLVPICKSTQQRRHATTRLSMPGTIIENEPSFPQCVVDVVQVTRGINRIGRKNGHCSTRISTIHDQGKSNSRCSDQRSMLENTRTSDGTRKQHAEGSVYTASSSDVVFADSPSS